MGGTKDLPNRFADPVQVRLIRLLKKSPDHQPLGRARGLVAQCFGQRAVECLGDLKEDQNRRIAHAVFEVGEMTLRDLGRDGKRLAGHAPASPKGAHAFAKSREKRVLRCIMQYSA